MAVTPRIEIKQSQSLLMTPQLRQAISILQLTNIELSSLVAQELESNPLLITEADADIQPSIENHIDEYDTQDAPTETEQFQEDIDYETAFSDDFGSDRAGYELVPSWNDRRMQKAQIAEENFDYIEQSISEQKSLYQILSEQIDTTFTSSKDKIAAFLLCEHLDSAGYFNGNLTNLAKQLKTTEQHLARILKTLQTFEPSGIFATSLKECLKIQLEDQNRCDVMMQKLLDNLELLAARDLKKLKKICEATDEDLSSMIADIKALNPKPAAAYFQEQNQSIIPDVIVSRNKYGEYRIELNQDSLPRILINREYSKILQQTPSKDKQQKKYLKEKLGHAGFLIKALHQRAETILKISEKIVKTQRDFFEKGINYLKPLLLKDIAEMVEMHESTVSRVTTGKYIETPVGTFELKYFFSAAAGTYNGDNTTSTASIKHRIKKIIDDEGTKVLSDDAIVEIMAAQSIKIARRTVAKYREEMGIPGSAERKRLKRQPLA